VIYELTRVSIPADLQPQQPEIQVLVQTVFQVGIGLLLTQYANRSPSSDLVNSAPSASNNSHRQSGNAGFGLGGDTAGKSRNSLGSDALSALAEVSNSWASEQIWQGLVEESDANNVDANNADVFNDPCDPNITQDWYYDPWPGSEQ
jgi:hypothetical protein